MDKAPPTDSAAQAAAPAPVNARVSDNPEVELALLRRDVEDLKASSGKKWYDFIAIAIGLFAGALALPRAVVDLRNLIRFDTKTTVRWNVPVDVSYSPPDRSMVLAVPFSINNEGTAKDEIEKVDVSLGRTGVPGAKTHLIGSSNIQFRDGTSSFPSPVYINNEENRSMAILVTVPAKIQDELLAGRDIKQLQLTFTLRNGQVRGPQSFCFDFAKEDYEDETASKEKHLYSPEC